MIIALCVGLLIRDSMLSLQNLRGANAATVKAALFGPTPYVIYCHRGGEQEEPPAHYMTLHAEFKSKVRFAMISCHSKLTDSANAYERLYLDPKIKPTIFITSPWDHAVQVPLITLNDLSAFRKFLIKAITPHSFPVTSEEQLIHECKFDVSTPVSDLPPCVVLVKGGKYSDEHAALEEQVVTHYRSLRVVSLVAMKHRLSFEDTMKNPGDQFGMKVYAIKGSRRYLSLDELDEDLNWSAIQSFVDNSMRLTLRWFKTISDKSEITVVKIQGTKKFKQR